MRRCRPRFALLVVLLVLGARAATADPKPPPCAGEIWNAAIERHEHYLGRQTSAGNSDPPPGRGFPIAVHVDYRVHGRYVSRPGPDGTFVWTHRTIDWTGTFIDDLPACRTVTCEASGERDLGPMQGGGTAPGITSSEGALIRDSIHCSTETKGNCFGYFPGKLELPYPEIVARDKLPYRKVDKDGTRHSVWVESLGDAHLTMWAHPTSVPPNKGANRDGGTDAAKSEIKVVASCDDKPLAGENIEFRLEVEKKSGGHAHAGVPRPRGKLNGTDCGVETGAPDETPCVTGVKTDALGHAKVTFEVPVTGSSQATGYGTYRIGIGGDYKVTARLAKYPEHSASVTVFAKAEGLQPFQPSAGLTGDANNTVGHPHGTYMTAGTAKALADFGADFQQQQQRHNDALIACQKAAMASVIGPMPDPTWPVKPADLNDFALPAGGIFDLNGTWKPSHSTHNKGEGGDFNRFGAGGGLNASYARLECDDTKVPLQWWWAHLLLGVGEKYGKWDCFDLGLGGAIPALITDATQPVPSDVGNWFPPRLHLHVEDKKQHPGCE
jgi:hypothetical protein